MYCYKCGKMIKDTAKFCNGCGAKTPLFDTSQAESVPETNTSCPVPPVADVTPKNEPLPAPQAAPVAETKPAPQAAPAPATAESGKIAELQWECEYCGTINPYKDMFCGNCFKNREKNNQVIINYNRSYTRETASERKSDWKCKYCGTVNQKNADFCKDCGKYR